MPTLRLTGVKITDSGEVLPWGQKKCAGSLIIFSKHWSVVTQTAELVCYHPTGRRGAHGLPYPAGVRPKGGSEAAKLPCSAIRPGMLSGNLTVVRFASAVRESIRSNSDSYAFGVCIAEGCARIKSMSGGGT